MTGPAGRPVLAGRTALVTGAGNGLGRAIALEARQSGITVAEAERQFVSRSALNRLVEPDEVAAAAVAMLRMPGLCGADIDLSAGMIAP